jgi:type IV pilus assembly protein PilM
VITSVGGHDVIIKKISMDRMNESDARDVIRWEAEQHVPFDINNVELDFQVLNPLDEGLRMDVLLVAAKRELVDDKTSLLLNAGLSPALIDIDAFALHNAFQHNYPEAMKGNVALVNVGHETTNVNILEDGVPVLTRDIPFGSRKVREDLQRERGLTAEEAEEVVQGRQKAADLGRFVDMAADEVAIGIERASAFLMTQKAGAGLGKVYLSGGGARLPGLAQTLSQRMGVQTEIVNPFERTPVRPGAGEGFVNLLPGAKKRTPRGRRKRAIGPRRRKISADRWMLGAGVIIIIALGYVLYQYLQTGGRIESLTLEIEQAARDSTQLAEVIGQIENLRARRDSIAQKVALLQEIDGDRYVWAHMMDEVARALPDYTWLTGLLQISEEGALGFEITGKSGNNLALTRFMENLEASPFIRNVTLITTQQILETGEDGADRMVNDFTLQGLYEVPPPEILETVPLFGSRLP